jgi:hypothetical protein
VLPASKALHLPPASQMVPGVWRAPVRGSVSGGNFSCPLGAEMQHIGTLGAIIASGIPVSYVSLMEAPQLLGCFCSCLATMAWILGKKLVFTGTLRASGRVTPALIGSLDILCRVTTWLGVSGTQGSTVQKPVSASRNNTSTADSIQFYFSTIVDPGRVGSGPGPRGNSTCLAT